MRGSVVAVCFAAFLSATTAHADDFPSPELARVHETAGRFDEAAEALERAVETSTLANSDAPRVRAWLERAIDYRIALGDAASAARDIRTLERVSADRDRIATLELDVASVFERERRWREGVRFHEAWLRRHAADASPSTRARALTQLADALREGGDTARATTNYRRATALYTGYFSGPNAQHDDPARETAARARFWVAEASYRAFAARRMPSYRGSETRRAWDAWAGRTLNRFIAEQMRFLNEDATQQYTVVVNMHVPTWEVAAYARLAEIFLQFAAYVRRAPLPPDLRRHPEIIDVYCAMRDDPDCGRLWVRFEHVAATGLRRCLRTATRLRQDNEWSRRCEQRLNELDQARFPLADEMRPTPDQGLRR